MDEFPYYGLSWFFYLLVTALFLLFCAWHSRNWSVWAKIPVLTFIAALALTPGVTISGETWWSPAAIIMIFELDQKGLAGIWKSGISIIAVWILFMIGTLLLRWRGVKLKGPGWKLFTKQPQRSSKATKKTKSSKAILADEDFDNDPNNYKDVELIDPDQ